MNKPALIVMSRWHARKRCKSRLAKDIGFDRAAAIQERLTNHTIKVAQSLEKKGLVEIQLAISGIGNNAANRFGDIKGIQNVINQKEGTLGLRMKHQILQAQKKNFKRESIVIGTDLPSLSKLDLLEALAALEENEMVLGPASDGGYWLIGFSKKIVAPLVTWPFSGIPWGTKEVLSTTIKRGLSQGIQIKLLRELNDLDNIEDLSPWQT